MKLKANQQLTQFIDPSAPNERPREPGVVN